MTPGTAKRKGAATEQMFVDYLKQWNPNVERRHLAGTHDRGDITGIPGVVFEVKSGAKLAISTWLDELEVEVTNDGATHGAVVVRPKGKPAVEDWFAVLPLPTLVALLREAGWLP